MQYIITQCSEGYLHITPSHSSRSYSHSHRDTLPTKTDLAILLLKRVIRVLAANSIGNVLQGRHDSWKEEGPNLWTLPYLVTSLAVSLAGICNSGGP